MENEKCLSIITNFGCHYKCPYCIVKTTGIKIPYTTSDTLKELLKEYQNGSYTYISISGGGDPLYNYENNQEYYKELHRIAEENNIPLEMHTSYQKEVLSLPLELYHRIVFHCNTLDDLHRAAQAKRNFPNNVLSRVVFVVEDRMDKDYIIAIHRLCQMFRFDELSFRQRVNPDYSISYHLHDLLQFGHAIGRWYYIEQGDYNTYFVNGKTIDKYCSLRNKKE